MRVSFIRLQSILTEYILPTRKKRKKLKDQKCYIMPSLKECVFKKVLGVKEYNEEGKGYKSWKTIRRECRRVHGILLDDEAEMCGLVEDPDGQKIQLPLSMILTDLPKLSPPSKENADELTKMIKNQLHERPLLGREVEFSVRRKTKQNLNFKFR